MSWVCARDLNEILDRSKKYGGFDRSRSQMEAFKQTLEDCHLTNMGFCGLKLMWSNRRRDHFFTQERLDRVVANKEWHELYPVVDVYVEAVRSSDHSPVFLVMKKSYSAHTRRGFCFDASWALNKSCKEVVKKVWMVKDEWGNNLENFQ
jgi:hypothetical protein